MAENLPPLAIELMLRCYYSPEPHTHDSWESPAGKDWRKALLLMGLIDEENRATKKGDAFVDMLTSTPIPEHRYVDPRNNMVVGVDND